MSGSVRSRPRRTLSATLVVLLVLAMVPLASPIAVATGNEYWVDESAGDDSTGDGSAGNPWESITHAMTQVSSGDTVWVCKGTYDINEETFPISLEPGVKLASCDGPWDTTIQGDGADNVMNIPDAASGTVLDGFTITNGYGMGAGLWITNSSSMGVPGWPWIDDCRIVSNDATGTSGGGIGLRAFSGHTATARITQTLFQNNIARHGAAISCVGTTTLTIEECAFENNTADQTAGAISIPDPTNTYITKTDFVENHSSNSGGAIYMGLLSSDVGTLTIDKTAFVSNEASGGPGGAIYGSYGYVELEQTIFVDNSADSDGGGFSFDQSTVNVSDSAFEGNYSGNNGGAMDFGSSEATITHCSLFGNTQAALGVIYDGAGSIVHVANSILWNDTDDITDSVDSIEHSCVKESGPSGTGVIHDDPQLKDIGAGDFRLLVGSPCIDTALGAPSGDTDFFGESRPQDGDGNGSAVPDMGCSERPGLEVSRFAGSDRYATASQAALDSFSGGCGTAVIASGENFPDALSAAGLAGANSAALLLVRQDSVPSVVMNALATLGVEDVHIIGGTSAVSAGVATTLSNAGLLVNRISGSDRYATSAAVARALAAEEGGGFSQAAFVVRGDEYPDALAAAPLAYNTASPILLTRPTGIPGSIASAIDDLDIQDATVCGGTVAVSAAAQAELDALLAANAGSTSRRWAGADRYATAAAVAEGGAGDDMASFEYVGVTTGLNFPDALAGGVSFGNLGGVILLTRTATLPGPSYAALSDNRDDVFFTSILGGSAAVDPAVEAAMMDALGW